jgi:flagellar motor switch protein FliM
MPPEFALPDETDWDLPPGRTGVFEDALPPPPKPVDDARPPRGRGVLSPAEIKALLQPELDDPAKDVPSPAMTALPRPFAQLDTPVSCSEQAHKLSARLSMALRTRVGFDATARVRAAIETDFASVLAALPAEPGQAGLCFAHENGDLAGLLLLSPLLVSQWLEAACGGLGDGRPGRALTPLDLDLLAGLLEPLVPALGDDVSLARVETDLDFIAALAPREPALAADLDFRLGGVRAGARLILAQTVAHGAREAQPHTASPVQLPGALATLLTARLVRLSVPVSQLANLKAGETLLLGVPADQPVQLLSGGRDGPVVAEGDVGRKGNAMAVRIARRVTL